MSCLMLTCPIRYENIPGPNLSPLSRVMGDLLELVPSKCLTKAENDDQILSVFLPHSNGN